MICLYLDAKVSSDGAWLGVLGVGLAKHNPASLDDVQALPDHRNDGSAGHVLAKPGVEGPGG